MALTHVVSFKFKSAVTEAQRQEIYESQLALATRCLSAAPESKPYIHSVVGGPNLSAEGYDKGNDFAFVMVFNSMQDFNYYDKSDPVHGAFRTRVLPLLEDAFVFDFVA
ncbi:unnamed protein product [Mycena citricolor]|uniref:Stress-response A/B barrel domain-containing protein n=1 Tax=Mycena citricolor TaxID=2018698 RepID=A0AAD2HZX4_9AGAR|nr:unnamed protein product [Mycena citricolor]